MSYYSLYRIMALIEFINHMANQASETLDHVTTIGVPIAISLAIPNSCLLNWLTRLYG